MNEIYDKLVLTRHINVLERQTIGNAIDLDLLKRAILDALSKHQSLPPGFKADDDTIQYSGYMIFQRGNDDFVIRQFGEISYCIYKLISEETFHEVTRAISRYITLEFPNGIDEISLKNSNETDREKLLARLSIAGVPNQAYSIDGGDYFENYGIQRFGKSWSFYHSERGTRRELAKFESEKDAYSELYRKLIEEYSRPRKYPDNDLIYIDCTKCKSLLKLPRIEKQLKIKCRHCNAEFVLDLNRVAFSSTRMKYSRREICA